VHFYIDGEDGKAYHYELADFEAAQANEERELAVAEAELETALAAHDAEAIERAGFRVRYWSDCLAVSEDEIAKLVAGRPLD
jgi:hypothetical protein